MRKPPIKPITHDVAPSFGYTTTVFSTLKLLPDRPAAREYGPHCTRCRTALRDGREGPPYAPRACYGPPDTTWLIYCPHCYGQRTDGQRMIHQPTALTKDGLRERMFARMHVVGEHDRPRLTSAQAWQAHLDRQASGGYDYQRYLNTRFGKRAESIWQEGESEG